VQLLLEAGADQEAKDKVCCGVDLAGTIARFRETSQPRAALVRNLRVSALRVVEGTAENCDEGDASPTEGCFRVWMTWRKDGLSAGWVPLMSDR
jgi:hypothetical protein